MSASLDSFNQVRQEVVDLGKKLSLLPRAQLIAAGYPDWIALMRYHWLLVEAGQPTKGNTYSIFTSLSYDQFKQLLDLIVQGDDLKRVRDFLFYNSRKWDKFLLLYYVLVRGMSINQADRQVDAFRQREVNKTVVNKNKEQLAKLVDSLSAKLLTSQESELTDAQCADLAWIMYYWVEIKKDEEVVGFGYRFFAKLSLAQITSFLAWFMRKRLIWEQQPHCLGRFEAIRIFLLFNTRQRSKHWYLGARKLF
jgi:hypothetical protein